MFCCFKASSLWVVRALGDRPARSFLPEPSPFRERRVQSVDNLGSDDQLSGEFRSRLDAGAIDTDIALKVESCAPSIPRYFPKTLIGGVVV
jgi:hypothetical protein